MYHIKLKYNIYCILELKSYKRVQNKNSQSKKTKNFHNPLNTVHAIYLNNDVFVYSVSRSNIVYYKGENVLTNVTVGKRDLKFKKFILDH